MSVHSNHPYLIPLKKHANGILSAADLDQKQITVRGIENEQVRVLKISKTIIQKTARHLIGELIRIEGKILNGWCDDSRAN
ncbi:MAG: hypothetical protein AAF849_17460 [Bacteroidota bacterium]